VKTFSYKKKFPKAIFGAANFLNSFFATTVRLKTEDEFSR